MGSVDWDFIRVDCVDEEDRKKIYLSDFHVAESAIDIISLSLSGFMTPERCEKFLSVVEKNKETLEALSVKGVDHALYAHKHEEQSMPGDLYLQWESFIVNAIKVSGEALRRLTIENVFLSNERFGDLCIILQGKSIVELNIVCCGMNAFQAKIMHDNYLRNPKLQLSSLCLDKNYELDDAGCKEIVDSAISLPNIEKLSLSYCGAEDGTGESLNNWCRRNNRLKELRVREHWFSLPVFEELLKHALKNESLRKIE